MKYTAIKQEERKRLESLSDKVGLFWAFSNEQFTEGKKKNPVDEGEKYTSIGAGGFLPSKNVQKWVDGMKAVEKWAKDAKKDAKEVILYELNNYECFYTGDIEDALPRLHDLGYTTDEIKKVYHANREFALN
jgi:hypothetical protein